MTVHSHWVVSFSFNYSMIVEYGITQIRKLKMKKEKRVQMWSPYIGKTFTNVTIDSMCDQDSGLQMCSCTCSCGRKFIAPMHAIIHGGKKSCGQCGYGLKRISIDRRVAVEGCKYGKLTVMYRHTDDPQMVHCKCDCGNECDVFLGNIKRGNTSTCGKCGFRLERVRSSVTKYKTTDEHRIAAIFSDMKKRCSNESNVAYKNYGGRGIKVKFKSAEEFVKWSLSHGYKPGLSIDRIDNNGSYSPDNCRWTDNVTQSNNRRNNRVFVVDGVAKTQAEWSRITGISYNALNHMPVREAERRVVDFVHSHK